ncbi:MAG: hypothetical protein EXX96DRAFT_522124 [Benjaminiella poitrasii]|nr:MAG: hypothetical protein EXX96DRAFT_522124 [Benjaminiella poitrasii]
MHESSFIASYLSFIYSHSKYNCIKEIAIDKDLHVVMNPRKRFLKDNKPLQLFRYRIKAVN